MESKLSGAWATASNASNRVIAYLKPALERAERFGHRVSLRRAVLEVAAAAAVWAALYRELKVDVLPRSVLAFMVVAASAVFLGAFRLSPSRGFWRGIGRELLAVTGFIAPTLVVQTWIGLSIADPRFHNGWSVAASAVCDLAVFVVGRFLVVGLPWWLRFNRRKLRWQMVHAHIVVVLIVLSLPIFVVLLIYLRSAAEAIVEVPSGALGELIVQFGYLVIPAMAIVVVLFGLSLIVIVPPSIALSYVVARRMTRRLEKLATATEAIRAGDHAARVEVQGVDEVAKLQTNFNAMAEVLETSIAETAAERDKIARLLDQRRELVASVSHELRTPLTIIRGHLDSTLAQGDALDPTLRHDLAVMHNEALRLQRLIDDLFALSRAEVGRLTLHPRDCDVAATLRRCGEAARAAAWRTGRVEIIVEPSGALPNINVDPDRLEQILFNLINNAARHSPPGGLIHLSAVRDGNAIRIDVADTGEGIAADELELIWDRFYRGRNAKDARGSGIGLAIVRELTTAMSGVVSVESTLGEGTRFTLRFPIEADLPILDDAVSSAPALPQGITSRLPANSQS